ncbi:TlpA family protein disulfide reductase [Leptospira gomenensis]|uniref:TlpA family protein disulfide reductase n=1 Tax=Leptospira gomenensis TaxID=2484974 RepID=A0A5F1YLT7_9LEPT|nr:thioredoxin-like domain-containing protein [Leptospira gomenensis]TGK32673.1 TlpA family protein disulfide reductase [Leptospira gomenensis]TGK36821.1 TlpA family protein disulfide reductase [Leptospira gomenensis]TGK39896.1 TlpA family protein disulfide reductase [Leptospira gomenensis]TGK58031.1 TlpA family protein disulfide reductase [Leptospira gomenensis]
MQEILKKTGSVLVWILLFLGITISLSIFKASDLRPGLSLETLRPYQGEKFESENKVSIVYFWATWCGVCSTNLPLVKWYADLLEDSQRFRFVSVEEGENPEELKRYVQERNLRFDVLVADASLLREWKVGGYPSFFVLDRTGKIRFADSGMMNPISFFFRIWITSLFL